MASVVMRRPEDFSIARGGTTIGGEWSGVAGGGASVVACPSGFGWALRKDTSVVNNHSSTRTIAVAPNGMGFAAFLTLNMPAGDATWRLIAQVSVSATNIWTRLTYQPSTNQFRLENNPGGGNVVVPGSITAGPATPSTAFHIAVETRSSLATAKIWINGVLVTSLTGVTVGSGFNRETVYAPTSTGAGSTTIGNVVFWDSAAHTWDGKVKVVERLAPSGFVSQVGTWTTAAATIWQALDEALVQSANSTTGTSSRMALSNMVSEPEEVYGAWFYARQQGTGQGGCVLHEPSFNHPTATTYTGVSVNGYIREYVAGPNAGGDWDKTSLDACEFSVVRASGNVQFFYANILVLRTLAIAAPPVGISGRAYIISSRPRRVS